MRLAVHLDGMLWLEEPKDGTTALFVAFNLECF